MDISQLQKDSYRIATEHGFYEGYDFDKTDPRACATRLMLIVTELAEAMEDVRHGKFKIDIGENENDYHPTGLPIELADAVIRIADFAEWQGYDLSLAIKIKQEYNETRPYKHGGKAV